MVTRVLFLEDMLTALGLRSLCSHLLDTQLDSKLEKEKGEFTLSANCLVFYLARVLLYPKDFNEIFSNLNILPNGSSDFLVCKLASRKRILNKEGTNVEPSAALSKNNTLENSIVELAARNFTKFYKCLDEFGRKKDACKITAHYEALYFYERKDYDKVLRICDFSSPRVRCDQNTEQTISWNETFSRRFYLYYPLQNFISRRIHFSDRINIVAGHKFLQCDSQVVQNWRCRFIWTIF